MYFDWNKKKNLLNIAKHGLDFECAKVLFSTNLLTVLDTRYKYAEQRNIGYGEIEGRLMCVVYTERLPDIIRIISFRKANYREQQIYQKNQLG